MDNRVTVPAHRCNFQEQRGSGWNEQKPGILIHSLGRNILIVKLSHGLRTLEITDWTKLKFDKPREEFEKIEISFTDYMSVVEARDADEKFSLTWTEKFEKITSQ